MHGFVSFKGTMLGFHYIFFSKLQIGIADSRVHIIKAPVTQLFPKSQRAVAEIRKPAFLSTNLSNQIL